MRKLVLGTWTDNYGGKRTLQLRADGTATMSVELTGISAALYAKRLVFEERWRIEDGRLIMVALSGTPKARANLILRSMGRESNCRILKLTQDQMLLLDSDGQTRYDWRRPAN